MREVAPSAVRTELEHKNAELEVERIERFVEVQIVGELAGGGDYENESS